MLFRGEAGRPSPATRTSRLCPHAWGLCRRMTALRNAKDPSCTRAGCVLFGGAERPPHTAWTPWLRPHAWGLCRRMDALWCDTGPACTGAGCVLFGGSGRPVPAARSSRLCPHAWGFADERALSGTRRAMLARGRSVWTGLEGQLTPLGHRGYARMRGGFAVEWTLFGVRKAPLS